MVLVPPHAVAWTPGAALPERLSPTSSSRLILAAKPALPFSGVNHSGIVKLAAWNMINPLTGAHADIALDIAVIRKQG